MHRLGFTTGDSSWFSCPLVPLPRSRPAPSNITRRTSFPSAPRLKYTTLIELPSTEKIMEAATGDKDFWIVDVVGNFCFVHPAKAGISSNLNLITDKGNIYSFTLQDVSATRVESLT
jgi:type IV secretory pathway VirB9-like protein